MASISDIPVEVLLDNVLPAVALRDLPALASANRFFADLSSDDTFWKRKLKADFNFSGDNTARAGGWKFIYKGLSNPKVFVWGQKNHGRLGLTRFPDTHVPDVPFPTELRIPGVKIISLVAGGWSFHALDTKGNVYVWGSLDGMGVALQSVGYTVPEKPAHSPLRLDLPVAMRSLSCGRLHVIGLDAQSHIWTFRCWGRPFRLVSPALDLQTPDTTPVQIECGWTFSAALTASGDVLVFWPFDGDMDHQYQAKMNEMDGQRTTKTHKKGKDIIECVTWDMETDIFRLPAIPLSLPRLDGDTQNEYSDVETKLVKIAGLDNWLIGLTNKGHVLMFGSLHSEETLASGGTWTYLPKFSELREVQLHTAFSPPHDEEPVVRLQPPKEMRITHISAHFNTFIAYSSGSNSVVLIGNQGTKADSAPKVIPELQYQSIISVVLGDYHFGALTSTGKLLTWGQYSLGALGLGDPAKVAVGQPGGYHTEAQRARAEQLGRNMPPQVEIPTEVSFNHNKKKPKERFCFAAAAAGWHMGALVIDLEPDAGEDDDADKDPKVEEPRQVPMPGQFPVPTPGLPTALPPQGDPTQFPMAGLGPASGIFRIGFAGRGMNRGSNDRGRGSGSGREGFPGGGD